MTKGGENKSSLPSCREGGKIFPEGHNRRKPKKHIGQGLIRMMQIDLDRAIIEPRRGRHEEPVPPHCVLVFTGQDLETLRRQLTSSEQRRQGLYLADVLVGMYHDCPVSLIGPMLGAPQTILILERAIALGGQTFLAVGWCGSLQEGIRIGDVILPTGAYSEEGTSSHYPLQGPPPGPSRKLLEALRKEICQAGLSLHEGLVWTTDAPFRETVGKVRDYQLAGALAVEMETSALLRVAAYRKVDLAVVLIVSDELWSLTWQHGFRNSSFLETRKKMMEIVLKTFCPPQGGYGDYRESPPNLHDPEGHSEA
jgi:uridine phosphorylase